MFTYILFVFTLVVFRGPQGLVAYGSQSNIVVLDSRSVTTVQCLQGGGRHDVTRIRWSRHLHYHDKVRDL